MATGIIYSLFVFNSILMFNFFYQVGIDLIGPLPVTPNGYRYIATLMDYFSKWPEAEPIQNKKAETVAGFLYRTICR